MKKKIITLVIVGLVLIMPTVIALSSAVYSRKHPVTMNSVSKLELSIPGRELLVYERENEGSADVYSSFINMNDKSDKVSSLTSDQSEYTVYTVNYHCYNKVLEYTYYLSSEPNNNFYRTPGGDLYHISEGAASEFLTTQFATELFPEAHQPTLNIGTTNNVIPNKITWKYAGVDGEFIDAAVNTSSLKPTCNVAGGLEMAFSDTPDYLYAVIKNTSGKVVFDDLYDEIDPTLFADNTVYDVTVTAKWYQSEGRNNYGEAEYNFTANVLSPAVFYMKTYDNITYGDFVVISAKNIVDPSQITFSSKPSINFTPRFFEYGGYYHALVPIPLAYESINGGELNYELTFNYGEVSQIIPLQLTKRPTGKDSQNISLETINELRNDTTIAKFNQTMAPYFANENGRVYWTEDNMIVPPTTRKVRSGFGIEIILSQAKYTYLHEGVNYYVKDGDTAYSCLPGKVVYIGDLELSGKTVVVDHGGGLRSLYAHLSSTSVTVGQVIEKNHPIGIVGSTGFSLGTTLHFGLYVYDIPVRYYKYEANGICIPEPIASLIK